MEKELRSPEPVIRLRNHFETPTADAIAAAKTCYSPSIILPETLEEDVIAEVGKTTYEGGHHTVYQHEMFEFEISNVSRAFTHDFLHTHPFYNSSQSSQRYVQLREPKATVPPIKNKVAETIFRASVVRSYEVYEELTKMLSDFITSQYRSGVTADRVGKKAEREIREKAMEAARYALSIAAHTHLVHTIDGVTLWRYLKMKNLTWEAEIVVSEMVNEVRSVDPRFPAFAEEEGVYQKASMPEMYSMARDGDKFAEEFDKSLHGRRSNLVGWSANAEEVIADGVRQVLGLYKSQITDLDAIDLVLNPANNPYLIDTVNLSIVSPLTRVLNHAQYTFKKKLSHTADSQDQRHRTIPGSRALTFAVNTNKPDYVTPEIIRRCSEAHKKYIEWMKELWEQKNALLDHAIPFEHASYVLPNSLAVRFEATGALLHLWYKFTNRSCLRAEEEIWQVTMEEINQINEVHPNLGKYLGPPCFVRKMAHHNREVAEEIGKVKYCNQGKLYCRQPVWTFYPKVSIENILKV